MSITTVDSDAKAVWYVWITFACIAISALCFATASTHPVLLFLGIIFLLVGSVCALAYLIRYVIKRYRVCINDRGQLDCCCWFFKGQGCRNCCNSCCRCFLCLPKQRRLRTQSSRTSTRSTNRNSSAEQRSPQIDVISQSNPASNSLEASIDTPVSQTFEAHQIGDTLEALEHEILRLRQQYEFLKRQECADALVEEDYLRLNAEEARIVGWTERDQPPSPLERKTMKGRLRRIARNFRLARARILGHDNGVAANMGRGIEVRINMDAPEQVRIFETEVPIPPEYSEQDPEPSSTQHFGRPAYTEQQPRTTLQNQSEKNNSSASGYDNPGFEDHAGESISYVVIVPPSDERDAPPPYEEAMASPI